MTSDKSKSQILRCDGCGDGPFAKFEVNRHNVTNGRTANYCDQCDALREQYDILLEDHEQYRLQELVDEIVERDST